MTWTGEETVAFGPGEQIIAPVVVGGQLLGLPEIQKVSLDWTLAPVLSYPMTTRWWLPTAAVADWLIENEVLLVGLLTVATAMLSM